MRVLVTGSAGFIGSWLAVSLAESGHTVFGLDRLQAREIPAVRGGYRGDLLDRGWVVRSFQDAKPDAVIHLAARTDLDEKRDLGGYAANIEGVRNVLDAARQAATVRRIIVTSSQLVCRIGHVPASAEEYCPDTLYGESKVWTERIVREWSETGIDWCIVRPTTVWGPGMSAHYQRMLQLIRRGFYFHCGYGKLWKSYAYVRNIAWQYGRLLEAPAPAIRGRMFYLADYEPLSLREYADALAKELGAREIPTLPLPLARCLAKIGDLLNRSGLKSFPMNSFRLRNILTEYVFDLSEVRSVCGPLPFAWTTGVRATAAWFLGERGAMPSPKLGEDGRARVS